MSALLRCLAVASACLLPAIAHAQGAVDHFFKPDVQMQWAERLGVLGGARSACDAQYTSQANGVFFAHYSVLLDFETTEPLKAALRRGYTQGMNDVKAKKTSCADTLKQINGLDTEIATQYPALETYQLGRLSNWAGYASGCGVPKERLGAFMQKVFVVTQLPVDPNLPEVKKQIAEGQSEAASAPSGCPTMLTLVETIEKYW